MCYYHHPSRCVSVRRMVEGGLWGKGVGGGDGGAGGWVGG